MPKFKMDGSSTGVKDNKSAKQMTIHGGLKDNSPKRPSGYGVKGGTNVSNGAVRKGVAPNMKGLPGRDA